MNVKILITASLDRIVSKLRVHDVVTNIFVHDVLNVVTQFLGIFYFG